MRQQSYTLYLHFQVDLQRSGFVTCRVGGTKQNRPDLTLDVKLDPSRPRSSYWGRLPCLFTSGFQFHIPVLHRSVRNSPCVRYRTELPLLAVFLRALVLGPLLFLIFINDLEDNTSGNVLKFADDTKIFRQVRDVQDNISM